MERGDPYKRYIPYSVQEYNKSQFNGNNYNDVYNPQFNQQFSVQSEPDIEYDYVNYYLTVSSRDRDISNYPNVNHYVVHFPTEFKNIYSIELVQAILPDKNNISSAPYLLLKVDEIEDVMVSADNNISDSFAILQPATPVTTGGFMQLDKRIHELTIKYYKIPRASLSKMTITITDCNGVPFDFGSDSNPPNTALQNTFVFRIICFEKNRNTLNHRNVY